ncbi:MAG: phosphoglucomutase/phosphomannomutase family protein [Candidatus Kapaibacterium sp.]|nr:phosphoglucomutase/phosphomannomutase family protein [Ignavibacteriota bacterium]MCB9222442.1 phosphoglucomutase/phosphomannomutase family protein [Ignavibacteria bacterium]
MIKFGTDGWRGVIAEDFTFANLRYVALASADYLKELSDGQSNPSTVIGYDGRFMSREFAEETAKVMASQGITVNLSDSISSTPQVSFNTRQKKAELGFVITASHNPAIYNGFKVKSSFGGPATPSQIARLEEILHQRISEGFDFNLESVAYYEEKGLIKYFDAKDTYIRHIKKRLDMEAIRKADFKVIFDPMHGAGMRMLEGLIDKVFELHSEWNPGFGNVDHPEPIESCLVDLISTIKSGEFDFGLATDGDADRLGAVDEEGNFVDSHKIFMILLRYLYENKGKRGDVVKTVSLTSMVDMYCEDKGITLHETPVGFKYTAEIMTEKNVLVGGEESGGLGTSLHIPERDGIFNGLLLLEAMAVTGKSLKELCDDLDDEFGPHRYHRIDKKMTQEEKDTILNAAYKIPSKIGRFEVERVDTKDGIKFYFNHAWLLIRASGTEPLLRFYAEAESMTVVNELLHEAMDLK